MRTVLLTLVTCLFVLPAQAKYSGGSGTAQDPYRIATAADLILLGETPADYDKHFVLTADIDLDPNLPGRKVFDKAVIAPDVGVHDTESLFHGTPFTGVFDGKGHTVSHLTITGSRYLGLFGWLAGRGAAVKNLGVVGVKVTGSGAYVGALVGNNGGTLAQCYSAGVVTGRGKHLSVGGLVGVNNGTVTECHSTGTVNSTADLNEMGGLVGYNMGGVTNCYSTTTVTCPLSGYVGGLVGTNSSAVTNCYSTGAVSGTGEYSDVGGLVGSNYVGTVADCYSTGAVTGTGEHSNVGALVGDNDAGVTQCYSTGEVSGKNCVGGLVGHSNDLAHGYVIGCFWDVRTTGQVKSAGGTGLTTGEMHAGGTFIGWWYGSVWTIDEGKDYPKLRWENATGQPIRRTYFYGGGSGTQADPYLIYTAQQFQLIGRIMCDWDKRFKLMADIDLSGFDGKGRRPALNAIGAGYPNYFRGVFDGNAHRILHVTIKGMSRVGLFGELAFGAEVKSLGVVDVNVTGSNYYVGGLVGDNAGAVTQCYITGTVKGSWEVGGLVGQNVQGTVTQCCCTAAVAGRDYVGGLVGQNISGTVTQCYSTGAVSGSSHVGGLVGWGGAGTTASFWDTQTSRQTISAGGTGKTTAQMQTAKTFLDAGWDFMGETKNGTADIWWILEGKDYPRLWWEARN